MRRGLLKLGLASLGISIASGIGSAVCLKYLGIERVGSGRCTVTEYLAIASVLGGLTALYCLYYLVIEPVTDTETDFPPSARS